MTLGNPESDHTSKFKPITSDGEHPTKIHVAFIGFMGAGKSTVAALLSQRCGLALCDTDAEIERLEQMTVASIFEKKGEAYFRQRETEVLARALENPEPSVIACGGGTILSPQNRRLLEEKAYVVYLIIGVEQALARFDDYASRPLLSQAGTVDAIFALMEARLGLMEAAGDVFVTTNQRTAQEACDVVISRLKEAGYEFLR